MKNSIVRLCLIGALVFGVAMHAAAASDDSLMSRVKHLFTSTPTPAPTPKKKKKTTTTRKRSPTPEPEASGSPRPKASTSSTRRAAPSPSPSEAPEPSRPESTGPEESPAPSPRSAERPEPSATAEEMSPPAATPPETPTPTPRRSASPATSPAAGGTVPSPSRGRTAPVSIASSEIKGYDKYPPAVRQILDLGLNLTSQDLGYKYGSADPANGGMDCSGFIYYVLRQVGIKDVPRDAREQYIWVRKAHKFQAVLGRSPDTFELDDLKPGDLMFWAGTYKIDRDPAITHTMIYLGREKATNERVMVGASDGRTYKGQSRFGVSVFDFKLGGRKPTPANEPGPVFVGYASIPGLEEAHKRTED